MYYHFTRGGNREVKYLAQGHTAKHQDMNPFLTRSKTQEHSEKVEAKQARLTQWLRQHTLPREEQEPEQLWREWTNAVTHEGPPSTQGAHAARGWQVVGGEKGPQVASDCLLLPDVSWKEVMLLSSRTSLLFPWESSNFSETLHSLLLIVCLHVRPEVLATQTLPTTFSCCNQRIWWRPFLQCRPEDLGL